MSEHFEPFAQVELDVLFRGGAQKATSPAATLAMGYRPANTAARAEKEETDVGVHLSTCINLNTRQGI